MGILAVRGRPAVRGESPVPVGAARTVPLEMVDRRAVLAKGRHVVRVLPVLMGAQTGQVHRVKRDVRIPGRPGVVLPVSRSSPMVKLARGRKVLRAGLEIPVVPVPVRGLPLVVRVDRHAVAGQVSQAVGVPKAIRTARVSPVLPHGVMTGSLRVQRRTSRV